MSSFLGKLTLVVCLAFFCFNQNLCAQENEEDFASLLDEILTFDSLLIAELEGDSTLLASLLEAIDGATPKSITSFRFGYHSEVLNAGRNFGINQYGFNGGVSYYHKSGLFADIAGLWSSDLSPKYYTTILGVGYMDEVGKSDWNYTFGYERYLYNESSDEIGYSYFNRNSTNASLYYSPEKLSIGSDYTLQFGEEMAHRVTLMASYNVVERPLFMFDKVILAPGFTGIAGNTTVLQPALQGAELLSKVVDYVGGYQNFRRLKANRPEFLASIANSFRNEEASVFGIMNYSFYVPLIISYKKASMMLSYNLNLPVALSGENIETTPNNNFSATLLYVLF